MWLETTEGENCGKPPKTVMAFANRYAAAGRVAARSGAAAQGRASAGRWWPSTRAGRGGGQSPTPARSASRAGAAPRVAARAEGDGAQRPYQRLVPPEDGLVPA